MQINVVLDPNLIAASFKGKEADLFALWAVLKAVDYAKGKSGAVCQNKALEVIMHFFNIKKRQAYNKIQEGANKYWSQIDGNKKIYIYSAKRINNRLNPETLCGHNYVLSIEDLSREEGWKYIKSFLMCLVAARMEHGRPISHQSIAENTGVSVSTVKRLIDYSDMIVKTQNINIIYMNGDLSEALKIRREQDESHKYVMRFLDGVWCVCKMLPNSYDIMVTRIPRLSSALHSGYRENRKYFAKCNNIKTEAGAFWVTGKVNRGNSSIIVWSDVK